MGKRGDQDSDLGRIPAQAVIVKLSGSPFDMGYAHGRILMDKVQLALEGFLHNSHEHFDVPLEYLRRHARDFRRFIEDRYLEELEGLAEGSEQSFDDILALNCVADIDACYMNQHHRCCNFIAGPPATKGGIFLHGRNLDFPPAKGILPKTAVVFQREPTSSSLNPTWAFGWAGFIGAYTIANNRGISIAEIGVPANDATTEGVPISLLIRGAAENFNSCTDITRYLRESRRSAGYNLAIGDAKTGEATCVEMTPSKIGARRLRKGRLIVDDVCLCRETARHRLIYPAGAFRYARMVQLFNEYHGQIDQDVALRMLGDRFDLCNGREGKNYNCVCNPHTVQSVLFFLSENRVLVSQSTVPAPLGEYSEIQIPMG